MCFGLVSLIKFLSVWSSEADFGRIVLSSKESMLNDWNLSVFCPVLKKGDLTKCANYRGICLFPIAYKALKTVWTIKVTRQNTDWTLSITIVIAACDSPIRDRVFAAMSELGIPAKLIRLCWMMLSNSCSDAKVKMHLSEPFDSMRGFRQANPLSCNLISFVM